MKIILNYMQKSDNNKYINKNNILQLEVFLFKYLHFEKKLITEEDFDKARGNISTQCKFPTEAFVKSKLVAAKCLRTFFAEKKDLSFLASLKKDYPEHCDETEAYLKQFYYAMICQMLEKVKENRHTREMKFKYAMMALSYKSLLEDAGLPADSDEKEISEKGKKDR